MSMVLQLMLSSCLMRRPPRSTLFPTRRSSDLQAAASIRASILALGLTTLSVRSHCNQMGASLLGAIRSEEHTSELQSRRELVCRLLLEKKKIANPFHTYNRLFVKYSSLHT